VKYAKRGCFALLAVLFAAGCSSSGSSAKSTPPSVPTSTPVNTPPTSTPAPTPTTTAPLSPFEADPAVKALRAWAAQAGRTVNAGHYDDAALNALMTPTLAKGMKAAFGGEVGHRYPGPLPFTPVRVVVASPTERDVRVCVVVGGYSLNPKTGKPFSKYRVLAIESGAQDVGGRWRVSKFASGSFSCSGVKIKEVSW
jgi:hypothetical protein